MPPRSEYLERLVREIGQGDPAAVRAVTERGLPTLRYEIHRLRSNAHTDTQSLAALRDELLVSADALLRSPVINGAAYIWHRHPFNLTIDDSGWVIMGETEYGDSVDDEYLIVSMLLSLSSTHDSLAIRVTDDDGDFLVIDAINDSDGDQTEGVPQWMTEPASVSNRVWIARGQVVVIDRNISPLPPSSPAGAVALIDRELAATGSVSGVGRLAVSDALKAALDTTLSLYPRLAFERNRHRAHCLLSLTAATVIERCPSIISAALEIFESRDLIDMRAANKLSALMPRRPDSTTATATDSGSHRECVPRSTLVPASVRFTQLLYSQILSRSFTPPRALLSHPAFTPYCALSPLSPLHQPFALGMKVMAALEMLIESLCSRRAKVWQRAIQSKITTRTKSSMHVTCPTIYRESDIESMLRADSLKLARWREYYGNVARMGLFGNHRHESKEYNEKLTIAWLVFTETDSDSDGDLDERDRYHLAVIDTVISELNDGDKAQALVQSRPPFASLPVDSDEWLARNARECEAQMKAFEECQRTKQPSKKRSRDAMDDNEREANGDTNSSEPELKSISLEMNEFLRHRSGFAGVEGPPRRTSATPFTTGTSTDWNRPIGVHGQRLLEVIGASESDFLRFREQALTRCHDGDDDDDEGDDDDESDNDDNEIEMLDEKYNDHPVHVNGESGSFADYLASMRNQLCISGDFETGGDSGEVDMDLNLLTNLLASIEQEEANQSGPASALMRALNIMPRADSDEAEAEYAE